MRKYQVRISRIGLLIEVIHFNREKLYVRHVLTHDEYDEGHWKDE